LSYSLRFSIKSALFIKSAMFSAEKSISSSVAFPCSYIYLIRDFIFSYCSFSFSSASTSASEVRAISPFKISTCISVAEISSLKERISLLIPSNSLSSAEVCPFKLSMLSSANEGKTESTIPRELIRMMPDCIHRFL